MTFAAWPARASPFLLTRVPDLEPRLFFPLPFLLSVIFFFSRFHLLPHTLCYALLFTYHALLTPMSSRPRLKLFQFPFTIRFSTSTCCALIWCVRNKESWHLLVSLVAHYPIDSLFHSGAASLPHCFVFTSRAPFMSAEAGEANMSMRKPASKSIFMIVVKIMPSVSILLAFAV